MPDIAALIQSGSSNLWLFIPSAILLGALHGLEPGHSKTMMAAFIIAVRGTVMQAVLLGLAAALSHTAVVWAVALVGLHFATQFNSEATEGWFQLVSAVLMIGIALWMMWRTWRDQQAASANGHHTHGEEIRSIDTGHGVLSVEIFEVDVPPCWRVRFQSGERFVAGEVEVETIRPDGTRQTFAFKAIGDYLQSIQDIPEPHDFKVRVGLSHGNHAHNYDLEFNEHVHAHGTDAKTGEYQDAHEKMHAQAIQKRFANRQVTTGQIVMFGLTGGLIPCPASITVLLICLQLKQYAMGVALVLCFSIGLAVTMVTVGAAAALSVNHVSQRWNGFGSLARQAPYFSSILIICVGLYTGYLGWSQLGLPHS